MFEKTRAAIARIIAPAAPRPRAQQRMYHAAKASRLTSGWNPGSTSADSELASSLTVLRNRSRALVRDAAYPLRAKTIIVNNVIGNGIPFQAQVYTRDGKLNARVNDSIESAWAQWAIGERCHTGGTLHFCDLERLALGEIFEAGEVFIRKHFATFGDSDIPLALELIEPERLADELQFPGAFGPLPNGHVVRMGVEVDRFDRPVAYYVRERHPGHVHADYGRGDQIERVPADQMFHLRVVNRWPQTRGEPWMHTVIRKLNDMDAYSEAEIVAARAAANYFASIEMKDGGGGALANADGTFEAQPDGSSEMPLEPGEVRRLAMGESMNFHSPNRPNPAMDPFMRMMLREVAAGVGVSYESISRDYSQSNYSSSRLSLLEDRDLWRVLQGWWVRSFRQPLHATWCNAAVLARAVAAVPVEAFGLDPAKFIAANFKPRGWSWVDPTKEVNAYVTAVRAGFMTVADVIALTGGGQDMEDLIKQRVRELQMMDDEGLVFDTDSRKAEGAGAAAANPAPPQGEDDDPQGAAPDDENTEPDAGRGARVVRLAST